MDVYGLIFIALEILKLDREVGSSTNVGNGLTETRQMIKYFVTWKMMFCEFWYRS